MLLLIFPDMSGGLCCPATMCFAATQTMLACAEGIFFIQSVCDRDQDAQHAVQSACLSVAALNHAVTEGPGSF